MKRNKTYNLLFACLLSAGALLTACSEDLGQTEVPAGSEAVTFRVDMAGTAEVKARGEGESPLWKPNDIFGILSEGRSVAYHLTGSNSLEPFNHANTLWWNSKTQTLNLSGWYFSGMTERDTQTHPSAFTVQADQSTEEGVAKSDFLYAPSTAVTYGQTNTLKFGHRMAKLRVNVKYIGTVSPDAPHLLEWLYQFNCKGVVAGDGTVTASGEPGIITPMKLSTPTTDYDESYEFIVPAQTLTGDGAFAKFTDGTDLTTKQCYLPADGIDLAGGKVFTLNLTHQKAEVKVSVGNSISWDTDGATGSGEVELP